MPITPFRTRARSTTGSAHALAPVTPDDVTELPRGVARGVYVGGAGDLVIEDGAGAVVTIVSGDHQYHPVIARRVLATGTTATAILALY